MSDMFFNIAMRPPFYFTTYSRLLSIYLGVIWSITSCQNINSMDEKTHKSDSVISKRVVAIEKDIDTLITTPCVVLIYPTLEQIEDFRKSFKDSTDFYTVADDNQYYMGTAIIFLDSLKTQSITREAKGTIGFKIKNGQTFKTRLDKLKWNIILFNGKDKPKNADITIIDEEYRSYMK